MKKIILGFFTIITFYSAVAQNDAPAILSFSEAVTIALENNTTIKRQQNQQYVNQAQKTSSLLSAGPEVTAFAQGWRTQGNQFIEQEARVVNDALTSNFYGTLDASITVFNGFSRLNSIKQSNLNLEAQQHLVNRTKQDVITNVANQYLQCLLDLQLLEIAKEDLATQQVQLRQISEMVDAGSQAKVDQYTQESVVKTAEVTALRAEIRLRNDLATLSQTLQLDPSEKYEVSEPTWSVENMQFESYDLDQLYQTAMTTRSDLQQSKHLVEANEKGVTISKSTFTPSLELYGSINSRYSDASTPLFDTQISDNLRRQYGLRLSIPIFRGFRNRTSYVQAKVNHDNAKLTLDNLENTVKIDVLNAYQNYRDAITNYEASQASYEAAQLAFDLEKERFELQASDLVAYTAANQRLIQAKGTLAQAKFTLLFQDILLQYAVGTLQIDNLPQN